MLREQGCSCASFGSCSKLLLLLFDCALSISLPDCAPPPARLQCCTCNMCGLGKAFDVILAAFATAW